MDGSGGIILNETTPEGQMLHVFSYTLVVSSHVLCIYPGVDVKVWELANALMDGKHT